MLTQQIEDPYPQLSRENMIGECKRLAEWIIGEGVDFLVKNKFEAGSLSDMISYPLEMQHWILPDTEPELYKI